MARIPPLSQIDSSNLISIRQNIQIILFENTVVISFFNIFIVVCLCFSKEITYEKFFLERGQNMHPRLNFIGYLRSNRELWSYKMKATKTDCKSCIKSIGNVNDNYGKKIILKLID